jgi:hypothetical protein
MILDFVITIFAKVFTSTYKWLDHYFIAYILNFTKGFEFAIIILAAILFLLINVFLTIKYLRKLPKCYIIEIVDMSGKVTTLDGLRVNFATYVAAESYARFYNEMYREYYKFKVIGLQEQYPKTVDRK